MTMKKSVSFQLAPEIKYPYTWSLAYQKVRKGSWHINAVDRIRFQRRVQQTKDIVEPTVEHDILT